MALLQLLMRLWCGWVFEVCIGSLWCHDAVDCCCNCLVVACSVALCTIVAGAADGRLQCAACDALTVSVCQTLLNWLGGDSFAAGRHYTSYDVWLPVMKRAQSEIFRRE
jgi:hypothetical protein